ncbi:MAG: hypothetical protein WBM13_01125 [Bacteroidia bacterium]
MFARDFLYKTNTIFVLLFFTVVLSRIPFLFCGYGVEEDSWGIALAAFYTKLSGIYEPSRLPGHPVQELIYSALWGAGPLVFNGLCAVFSGITTVYFALILKHLNFTHFFLAALAFAFIPVFYISSTYTIDFVWTEAFVLMSFYYLLKEKYILTGLLLGLAIGCRITSGAMLLPFMIVVWQNDNLKQNFVKLLKIGVPMAVISILAFVPVIKQFGLSFFMYYDQFPYPPFLKVMYKMVIGVFGLVGTLAIIVTTLLIVFNRKKITFGQLFQRSLDKRILTASYVIIILFIISYFRLPQKSGYMIPVLPCLILLFGYYASSNYFKALCIALIVAPFICSINLTDKLRGATYSKYSIITHVAGQEIFFDPFSGPIFSDYSKRKLKINYTNSVLQKVDTINQKTVVIAGWWYNQIMVELIEKNRNNFVIFEFYIDAVKIEKYLSEGYKICYLPEQNIYNDLMYKMNITNTVSTEF